MNYDKKRECQTSLFWLALSLFWHSRSQATLSDTIRLDSMFGEKSPKTSDLIDKPGHVGSGVGDEFGIGGLCRTETCDGKSQQFVVIAVGREKTEWVTEKKNKSTTTKKAAVPFPELDLDES